MSDSELLQRFARQGDQAAFAEIVQRHLNLVYSTAVRLVHGDAHAAKDICQHVFIDLARKAHELTPHPCLAGWLYASTRFAALHTLRSAQRRTARETEAQTMSADTTPASDWDRIRPVLDDALQELDPRDREFVVLRFFGQQSYAAIAQQFSVTENAAQKAVSRALDVLNGALSRRGVTSTATALTAVLGQSIVAAPTSLVGSITGAAASGVAASTATSILGVVKLAAVVTAAAGLAGAYGYWTGTRRQLDAVVAESAVRDRQLEAERRSNLEKLRLANNRIAAAEAETATLLQAIERAKTEREKAVAAAGPSPIPAAQSQPYSIKPGDSASKIARIYRITLPALRDLNPDVDWARLKVGQTIKLP